MFERLNNLIKGMLDKGLSKAETPEVLAQQAQSAMESDIKELKQALVASVTNEKLIEQQLKKSSEEKSRWEKQAALSVAKGEDDLAKQCLEKKAEQNQLGETLTAQLSEQKKASTTLKEKLGTMEERLQEFLKKKPTMLARAQAGDALAQANELLASAGSSGGLDKWERKIREKELAGEALRDTEHDAVDDQFKKLSADSAIDDELAALKAKVSGIKLVVDDPNPPAPRKEIVDDNLPMVVDVEEIKTDSKTDPKKS